VETIRETASTALYNYGANWKKGQSAKVGMVKQAGNFLADGYFATDLAPIEVDDSVNTSSPQFLREAKRSIAKGCLTAFALQLYTEQEDKGIHGKGTKYYKDARQASAKVERARGRLYLHAVALELKEAPQDVQDKHAEVSQCTKAEGELVSCTRRAEDFMQPDEKAEFMKGKIFCLQAILNAKKRLANQ
jgi:hypothetical protein